MNKTERITYAFNIAAPGGRYKNISVPQTKKIKNKIIGNLAEKEHAGCIRVNKRMQGTAILLWLV